VQEFKFAQRLGRNAAAAWFFPRRSGVKKQNVHSAFAELMSQMRTGRAGSDNCHSHWLSSRKIRQGLMN
jgi:hypothetical protein